MELKWKTHKWDFIPTTTQLKSEVKTAYKVMDVHRGTLIKSVSMRVGIEFDGTTPVASVGDGLAGGADTEKFMTETEAAITSADLKNGAGEYLVTPDTVGNTGVSTNGKLYTEDDTIDLFYTGVAGTSKGQLSVIVVYAEIE